MRRILISRSVRESGLNSLIRYISKGQRISRDMTITTQMTTHIISAQMINLKQIIRMTAQVLENDHKNRNMHGDEHV